MRISPEHFGITGQPGLEALRQGAKKGEDSLMKACQDFEGMLTSIVMKEGMKPGFSSDSEPGSDQMRNMAVEQAAMQLGRSGSLGIADMLHRQLEGNFQGGATS